MRSIATVLMGIALLMPGSATMAATDLQLFQNRVDKFGGQAAVGIPPPPGAERDGLCLCQTTALGPTAGILVYERFNYSFPLKTRFRMRCWIPEFNVDTGESLTTDEECSGTFVPLVK